MRVRWLGFVALQQLNGKPNYSTFTLIVTAFNYRFKR